MATDLTNCKIMTILSTTEPHEKRPKSSHKKNLSKTHESLKTTEESPTLKKGQLI